MVMAQKERSVAQKVTFLRHGRSLADDEKKFEGRYDSPLTNVGKAQAARLRDLWAEDRERVYERIVASPLSRAFETAHIIAGPHGPVVEDEPLWLENDGGALAGLTYEEGNRRYPIPAFVGYYQKPAGGTGESVAELHGRASLALAKLMNVEFSNTLVVAHGGILQAAIRNALGIPLPSGAGGVGFWFRDLSYLDVAYERTSDRWTVLSFQHLPEQQ